MMHRGQEEMVAFLTEIKANPTGLLGLLSSINIETSSQLVGATPPLVCTGIFRATLSYTQLGNNSKSIESWARPGGRLSHIYIVLDIPDSGLEQIAFYRPLCRQLWLMQRQMTHLLTSGWWDRLQTLGTLSPACNHLIPVWVSAALQRRWWGSNWLT